MLLILCSLVRVKLSILSCNRSHINYIHHTCAVRLNISDQYFSLLGLAFVYVIFGEV